MTSAIPALATAARTGRLSPAAAFVLQASITVSFLAGSSAPTPLYPLYQAAFGFSAIGVTVIFGIYAVAVLCALLAVGRLSDHVGRRPVLLAATAMQAVTMLLFATAQGMGDLLAARVLQGLSAGAAVAAVGAGLMDLDKQRGVIANAISPMLGTALGGVGAGLLVQFLPAPTHLVYGLLAAVFAVQFIGVLCMAEPAVTRPGAWASLKPQLGVPLAVRGAMLRALPALVATWALAGFYGSLAPTLVRGLLDSSSPLLGGLALFMLAGSGVVAVMLLQHRSARTALMAGASALLAGVALTLLALSHHHALAFFVGIAVSGLGFGGAFQGAVRTVMPFVAPGERAGVLSVIFVVCYLSMGVPAVGAGWVVARRGDILLASQLYGASLVVLTLLALAGGLWPQRRSSR
jgi:predicted MFS family arabinose efflux permease